MKRSYLVAITVVLLTLGTVTTWRLLAASEPQVDTIGDSTQADQGASQSQPADIATEAPSSVRGSSTDLAKKPSEQEAKTRPVNNNSTDTKDDEIVKPKDNSYAWGNCTWYVYSRRSALGLAVGNDWGQAKNWLKSAELDGIPTGDKPVVGAIMWKGSGRYGNVSFIESIDNERGIVYVSGMNNYSVEGGGFGRVSTHKFAIADVSGPEQPYRYIY